MLSNRSSRGIAALAVVALLAGCASPKAAAPTDRAASKPPAAPAASAAAVPAAAPAPAGDIVFASKPSSSSDGSDQVYVMSADGTNQRLLIADLAGGWMPDFSPDRTKIAFSSERAGDGMNIYQMNVDGSNVTKITTNDFNSFHASWSPDGKRILFQAFPGGSCTNRGDLCGRSRRPGPDAHHGRADGFMVAGWRAHRGDAGTGKRDQR